MINDKCQSNSKKQDLEIRNVASFIGTLISTFPANEYGRLYYRAILKNKDLNNFSVIIFFLQVQAV